MKIAVKVILGVWFVSFLFVGCGRDDAKEVLLESSDAVEEASGEEVSSAVMTQAPAEETSVIQVVCECQCQNASGQTGTLDTVQTPVEDGKVNINTADVAQLQTLSGIGETRARAIISYRESHGAFQRIEDIKNVQGIKDGVYDKIKDDITV